MENLWWPVTHDRTPSWGQRREATPHLFPPGLWSCDGVLFAKSPGDFSEQNTALSPLPDQTLLKVLPVKSLSDHREATVSTFPELTVEKREERSGREGGKGSRLVCLFESSMDIRAH